MRKFRIHNDIPVTWRIVDKQTLLPFDLEGKTVQVNLSTRFGITPINDFSVSGNIISFIFKASDQRNLGVYTATASIVDSESGQTWVVDDCQMLELVARSCCVDSCSCRDVDATSCIEFAQFIVVDQELEKNSTNPVAGGAVAKANEELSERISNNEPRVFKYHVDAESETPAAIETGDDWIHNSAVLDWLFRNGVEGVDRAEVNVPCVVIGPAGDSGFAQNILGSTNAIWGEVDNLVYFNAIFSSQITQASVMLNAYYSRAKGSTTWNKNQLGVSSLDLQTVDDNPVERGSGAYSLQQKAEPNNENNASGLCSTALGHSNEATEHCSYVEGYDNASGGWASHVEGVENTATANAHFAHVGGTRSEAGHEGTFVHGRGLKTASKDQAVIGTYNEPDADAAFQVGGGTSDTDRRNAFTVSKDSRVGARIWGESVVTEMKSVTYAELISLRRSHSLVPGRFYRITDYVTTTNKEKTKSAGNPFDVIVLATANNILSEEAWAINHDGETYFTDAGANLEAWKIWYSLDNDAERFEWAAPSDGMYPQIELNAYNITTTPIREKRSDVVLDGIQYYAYRQNGGPNQSVYFLKEIPSTGDTVYNSSGQAIESASVTVNLIKGPEGKGVIYRMIDEWGNDIPYDFKNIQYVLENPIVDVVVATYGTTFPGKLTRNTSIDTETGDGEYYGWDYKTTAGPSTSGSVYTKTLDLSTETVFYSTQSFSTTDIVTVTSVICEAFTFGVGEDKSLAGNCHHNIIRPYWISGMASLNRITFGSNCFSNSFGSDCFSNSFGSNCFSNSFEDYCFSNSFGSNCNSNSFGSDCFSNSFGSDCFSNSFGSNCFSNSFGSDCFSNSFGSNCNSNSFEDYCDSNSFEDYCNSNSFGSNCNSNSLGQRSSNNELGGSENGYYINIIFESGVQYVKVTSASAGGSSSWVKSHKVVSGVIGTKEEPIEVVAGRRYLDTQMAPQITVAVNSAGNIVTYCEADLVPTTSNTEE